MKNLKIFADLEKWSNSLGDRKFDILHVLWDHRKGTLQPEFQFELLIFFCDSFPTRHRVEILTEARVGIRHPPVVAGGAFLIFRDTLNAAR